LRRPAGRRLPAGHVLSPDAPADAQHEPGTRRDGRRARRAHPDPDADTVLAAERADRGGGEVAPDAQARQAVADLTLHGLEIGQGEGDVDLLADVEVVLDVELQVAQSVVVDPVDD